MNQGVKSVGKTSAYAGKSREVHAGFPDGPRGVLVFEKSDEGSSRVGVM